MSAFSAVPSSRPYQPDNGFSGSGLLMLSTALVMAGSVVGYVAHFLAQHFWLIFVFPLGIGVAIGWVGIKMVVQGKIRNPYIGGIAGLLGGIFAMLVMHHSLYSDARSEAFAATPALEKFVHLPLEQQEAVLTTLKDPEDAAAMRALRSFPAYMDFSAHEGVSIGHGGSSGLNLGYVGTYIYWIVEVGIVAAIAFGMIRTQTSQPYCRACQTWKTKRTLGPVGDPATTLSTLDNGDVAALASCLPHGDSNCLVWAHLCPACEGAQSDVDVKLAKYSRNNKGKLVETPLTHVSWPGQTWTALRSAFVPTPAAPPLPPTGTPDEATREDETGERGTG